jgi:hypothetical protein
MRTAAKNMHMQPCYIHANTGVPQTAENLCKLLGDVVDEVGPKKIILLCSDSAPNCKAAGRLLEERFPHLSWIPCSTHVADLLLKVCGNMLLCTQSFITRFWSF